MKCKLLPLLIFLLGSQILFAQRKVYEQELNSKIKDVTVFLNGAELNHSSHVNIRRGLNKIRLVGMADKLDPNTIIVDVYPKEVTIVSVYARTNHLAEKQHNQQVKIMKDSLQKIDAKLIEIEAYKNTLEQEKELLYSNLTRIKVDKEVETSEVERGIAFFRVRSNEIDRQLFNTRIEGIDLEEIKQKLDLQMVAINAKDYGKTSEISIEVMSDKPQTIETKVQYYVANAGWSPKYDIYVSNYNDPIEMMHKADIFNNTGLDWDDVSLKISNADPKSGAEKPELDTWFSSKHDFNRMQGIAKEGLIAKKKLFSNINDGIVFKPTLIPEMSMTYQIDLPYTILADSKPYTVGVTSYKLPAVYGHFAIPKMDKGAYMIAKIAGWTDLNLMNAVANVYFKGSYIGKSDIVATSIEDSLVVSLGPDELVKIERRVECKTRARAIIGNKYKEIVTFQILVQNTQRSDIDIEILDQIPVSSSWDYKVKAMNTGDASYNKYNGELSWNLIMAPGETQLLTLEYSVKSDKYVRRGHRRYRTIICPSF